MSAATAANAAARFELSSIGQIAITISDLERAVAFYRDALGVKLLFEAPGLAFFDCT
ncbi:MAG: VOC family protein [Bryobacteraceae bacterium]